MKAEIVLPETAVNPEVQSYRQALDFIIERGIKDETLKSVVREILNHHVDPRFYSLTATKSGKVTNEFLSQHEGSELYHVLCMCHQLNRSLQSEPCLRETGCVFGVKRNYFEPALAGVILHDIYKCGVSSDFDSSTSCPDHAQIAAERFLRVAQEYGLKETVSSKVAIIIRFHGGLFTPSLKEKFDYNLSLEEIFFEEIRDKIMVILARHVHELDMLTSNGTAPSPGKEQREDFIAYLLSTEDYLKCAGD
ncbi:MAG: hypothetical protein M1514_03110 [Patescibacteria group bacterium]|nr:hypothetical protein [Patescibacteria group bacterium]